MLHINNMENTKSYQYFDDYYHSISEGLGEDPAGIEYFSSLETDEERVKYLLIRAQDRASEAVSASGSLGNKDGAAVDWYLQGALSTLQEGNVGRALRMCNSAVRLAPECSTHMQEALAFRASLLSKLHYFEDALKDCNAIDCDTANLKDETKIKVLLVRSSCHGGLDEWDTAERCLSEALECLRASSLTKENKAALAMQLVAQRKAATQLRSNEGSKTALSSVPKIQASPALMSEYHPSIPYTCDALELRNSTDKGRHFVATDIIPAGSVLITEEPFAWMLAPSAWSDHCAFCCRPGLSTLPCRFCFAVSFCDASCREAAWTSFHRWECGLLDHFASSRELSTMAQLVLRVVVSAGLDNLHNPLSDPYYQAVFCQVTNSAKRPLGDMVKRTLTAIFLEKCLEKTGFCGSEESVKVASALLRHLQSCSCNAYEITEHVAACDGVHGEAVAIGGAVYSSISLVNHACNNNVARHSHGRTCIVRAVRTINKGEEILDNYGYSFLSCSKQERQTGLNRQYFFTCMCDACTQNWPLYSELTTSISLYRCVQCKRTLSRPSCQHCNSTKEAKNIEKKIKNCLANYNKAIAKLTNKDTDGSITILLNCLRDLDEKTIHPNKDFIKCQQALIRCWSLMGNVNNIAVLRDKCEDGQ